MAGKKAKDDVRCSFCGKSSSQVRRIIVGPDVFICNECIDLCASIIDEEDGVSLPESLTSLPKPKEIFESLSEYVIEQEPAKRALAVAVYNQIGRAHV